MHDAIIIGSGFGGALAAHALVRAGRRVRDHVWKDTVLLPAGSTVDLLVELDNPGRWMLHCHIAEHLETGMHLVMNIE